MKALFHKCAAFAVVPAAAVILGWTVSRYDTRRDWVIFFLVAAATIPFNTRLLLSVLFAGAPLLMAIAMIYGTPACVLAAAAYGLLAAISLRRGFPGTAWTLSVCVAYMVCEAFLYSTAYHLLRPANLFLAIVAMAFVSYLVTSLLRYRNESWTDRVPLLLNSFLAASCAAFLAVFPHPFIAVVAIPMVAVIRYWTKIHEGRLGGVGIQEISTAPRSTQ